MSMHLAAGQTDISKLHHRTCTDNQANVDAVQLFANYFQSFVANTPTERQLTYRLRHKVYCEELRFEPLRDTGMEQDVFDSRAIHAGIRHIITGKLVGTVRIITSDNQDQLLPVEQFFTNTIAERSLLPANFSRDSICEISRLAVPDGVRCNVNQDQRSFFADDEQCCKLVSVALYLLTSHLCMQQKRHHCYVMVEPRLARSLRRIGIHFIQIGDVVDYNGLRAPHYLDTRTLHLTLKPQYQQLKDALVQQMAEMEQVQQLHQRTA